MKASKSFVCIKIDGDREPKVVGKYGINGYPAVYFLSSNEKVIEQIGGYIPAKQFLPVMEQVMKEAGPTVSPATAGRAKQLLSALEAAWEREDYAAAAKKAREILDLPQEAPEKADAQQRMDEIEEKAKSRMESAQSLEKESKFQEAAEAYRKVMKEFAGAKASVDAEKAVAKLNRRPEVLRKQQEGEAKKIWAEAQKLEDDKKYASAIKLYQKIVSDYPELSLAGDALKRKKALEGDPAVQAALNSQKGEKECRSWLSMARSWVRNGNPAKAREVFQKIIDNYPDSSFAEEARKELEAVK